MYYTIKWRKSKDLLNTYIQQHNDAQPALRHQLRSSHKQLAEYLLFIYSTAIAREQAYGDAVHPNQALPMLRTNNVQLSKAIGCSIRTVINLRRRLTDARLITKEVYHGGNAQYELEINPMVVHIELKGRPDNVIHHFIPGMGVIQQQPHASAALGGVQTLRHTVPSTLQDTNKLIELSGANFQQSVENQQIDAPKSVESCGKAVENVINPVENTHPGSGRVTKPELGTGYTTTTDGPETSPPVAAAPPQQAPEYLEDVIRDLPEALANQIRRFVTVIWTAANLQLYADRYIHEQEAERAKAVIAEYFVYARPDRYSAGADEILERITLVKRWIDRCANKGQKKWLRLPGTYFDFRNPGGFVATKAWYKQHIQAKRDIKGKELLTKALREYLKSREDGAKISTSDAYRRISQRLGKYDQALLNRFHEQISDLCNQNSDQKQPIRAATN